MICCTAIAALLALIGWPARRLVGAHAAPLAWRPYAPDAHAPDAHATDDGAVRFSFTARARSIGFAIEGLRTLVRREHNARVHLAIAALVVATGAALRIDLADWRWLVLAIALVLAAEAGNTAIEDLCDLVHPERHPVIKRIKDLAAAAVLLCALAAAGIGAATFAPYLHAPAWPSAPLCGHFAR